MSCLEIKFSTGCKYLYDSQGNYSSDCQEQKVDVPTSVKKPIQMVPISEMKKPLVTSVTANVAMGKK
jgi:hypothetical protein